MSRIDEGAAWARWGGRIVEIVEPARYSPPWWISTVWDGYAPHPDIYHPILDCPTAPVPLTSLAAELLALPPEGPTP